MMQQAQSKTGEGYIKKIKHEGADCFALFDEDGNPVIITENRSITFFTAAERDITVRMLN